ncbi:MAG: hypothetical protein E7110_01935 [Bacteroidales bacterium]|nr:hypothetical protein [Bacteroidales bacterium]
MVYSADNYKNQEIRDMYYIIYNNRLREGVDEKQAKRIAYDSVSSRFSITNDRIRHILYTKGCNPAYRTFFYTNNREILTNLRELVRHYEGVKKMWVQVEEESGNELSDVLREKIETVNQKILKYHKLIALIEEVNAEYSKQGR